MTLSDFFDSTPSAALAFSGGVDSAYLLYAAIQCGVKVRAYYVKTAFQPQFELDDAQRLTQELGADMWVLTLNVLADQTVISNPPDRCYFCKKRIFSAIAQAAKADGFDILLDGTNASDDARDRPGIRALRELSVRSPLRECGVTKADIRRLSREAGLFTWNKPAYACLATRVPSGEEITSNKLRKTEMAENFLFSLGFTGFRVRLMDDCARIQVPEGQLPQILERRAEILDKLSGLYRGVLLDLEVRNGS